VLLVIYFTADTAMAEGDIPAGATLAVDDSRREIIAGHTYALQFRNGRCSLARVNAVRARRTGKTVDLNGAKVLGELVSWWTERPPTRH
jgi:hypothetical protein